MRRVTLVFAAVALMITSLPGVANAAWVTEYKESEVIITGAWRAGTVSGGDVWQEMSFYVIGFEQGLGRADLVFNTYTCPSGAMFDWNSCEYVDGFEGGGLVSVEWSDNARRARVSGSIQGISFDVSTRTNILNSNQREVEEVDGVRYRTTLIDTSGSRPPRGVFQSHQFTGDDIGSSGIETTHLQRFDR